mmetsp:Transcript_20441/g.35129  ORF Transcript_20441/g.35129 Transcript_20441/m.35129 type:complete len:383 (+) Transcript_20441:115-1263(+)
MITPAVMMLAAVGFVLLVHRDVAEGFSAPPTRVLEHHRLSLALAQPRLPLIVHVQNEDGMDAPYTIYPNSRWGFERAAPKASLTTELHQNNPAPAWLLNIIELAHWVSFPLGFQIAGYLFSNASAIAKVGNLESTFQVFLIMLGILNQVFGGGMAVLMHVYEGWMISPFKNLIVLPSHPTAEKIDAIRIKNFNNAWLRAAAYQMLMTFQSLGLALFSMGVFGIKPWTQILVAGTISISLIGPKEPRLHLSRKIDGYERPVLPLSLSLTVVLVINVIVQLLACIKLFYPAFSSGWPMGLPFLSHVPVELGALLASILPSTLQGAGGGIEGYFAESSFKQWQHLGAFLILLAGFILLRNAFVQMVMVGPSGSSLPALFGWVSQL